MPLSGPSYRWHTVFCLLAITGCGRYADFSLPAPLSGEPPLSFVLEQAPRPVLTRGATGEGDAADVLNPSVVEPAGLLYNFYSGFDGKTWHPGLATSRDGMDWG